jgi:ribosome-binding factor A
MREEEIKRKRTEARLQELIPEALATMNDSRINSLSVTDVVCSRGRYDAKVYLDKSFLSDSEQKEALKQLKVVSRYLSNYIKNSEGWFKAPKFTFEFDNELERISHIEELFKKIAKEKSGGSK